MSPGFCKVHDYNTIPCIARKSFKWREQRTGIWFQFSHNSYFNLTKTIFLCCVVSLQGDQGVKVSHNPAALPLCQVLIIKKYYYFIASSRGSY